MKKIIVYILTVVLLIISLVSCQQKEYRETIVTTYGDELEIYAYLSGNLHGMYFTCEIRNNETNGYAYFYDKNLTSIPSDISNDLYTITRDNNIKVYELYNEYIILSDDRIDNFSSNYDLKTFIEQKNMGISVDIKCQGIKALCNTKKFKYIKQFADILMYDNKNSDISFINSWALGSFTDEELDLNKDYSKEEIMEWCINFINR